MIIIFPRRINNDISALAGDSFQFFKSFLIFKNMFQGLRANNNVKFPEPKRRFGYIADNIRSVFRVNVHCRITVFRKFRTKEFIISAFNSQLIHFISADSNIQNILFNRPDNMIISFHSPFNLFAI